MTTRKKVHEKRYIKYLKASPKTDCNFCEFSKDSDQVIAESPNFWIVKNIFGYDIWDNMDVIDHLMIVPKKHMTSLAELDVTQLQEYSQLLAKYEAEGYSFYARASTNKAKSVAHQHTHLLKLGNKQKHIYFFMRSPYILWYR
jgi:diadenosine tetraphosphate (Ap4A) HIT family hydrolase